MPRASLKNLQSHEDIISELSEGVPGAINILCALYQSGPQGIQAIASFYDMNMWGTQIWQAYLHCHKSIMELISACTSRDPDLVETVNKACPQHVAVRYGAACQYPQRS